MRFKARILDWFAILVIPVILFALYFIPKSWHDALVLNRDNPTILGVVGNSYVHAAFWTHLIPNIVAYFLILMPTYFLLLSMDKRRLFYQVFLLNILVLPTLNSVINLYVALSLPSLPPNSLGFSGVDASLLGAFLIAVMIFGNDVFGFSLGYSELTLVSFMALLFVFQYGYALGATEFFLAIPILLVFAFFFVVLVRSGRKEGLASGKPITPTLKVSFLIIPLGVLLLFAAFLYPQTVIIDNSEVNVFEHYAGILIGIVVAALLGERATRPKAIPSAPAEKPPGGQKVEALPRLTPRQMRKYRLVGSLFIVVSVIITNSEIQFIPVSPLYWALYVAEVVMVILGASLLVTPLFLSDVFGLVSSLDLIFYFLTLLGAGESVVWAVAF